MNFGLTEEALEIIYSKAERELLEQLLTVKTNEEIVAIANQLKGVREFAKSLSHNLSRFIAAKQKEHNKIETTDPHRVYGRFTK